MQIKNPKFELSAMSPSQYPKGNLPEIVLAGKSNVGKSSFINAMIGRKSLARTSSAPGKTRQLNFYNMDDTFYFVDLPGYGYSEMSKAEQAKVASSVNHYLANRKQINLILLLIDIRHDPGVNDRTMLDYIRSTGRRYLVIATKSDKIAKTKVPAYVANLANELQVPEDLIFAFSSETKHTVAELWDVMEESLQS